MVEIKIVGSGGYAVYDNISEEAKQNHTSKEIIKKGEE